MQAPSCFAQLSASAWSRYSPCMLPSHLAALPIWRPVVAQAPRLRRLREHLHFISHHEGWVEAYSKLANDFTAGFSLALQCIQKCLEEQRRRHKPPCNDFRDCISGKGEHCLGHCALQLAGKEKSKGSVNFRVVTPEIGKKKKDQLDIYDNLPAQGHSWCPHGCNGNAKWTYLPAQTWLVEEGSSITHRVH